MSNFLKFTIPLLLSLQTLAQVPTGTINALAPVFCTDVPLRFTATTGNSPEKIEWSVFPATGTTLMPAASDTVFNFSVARPGSYTITLAVSSGSLSSSVTKKIVVSKSAVAAFNASFTATGYPTDLVLTNYSSDSPLRYWIFSDLADSDTSFSTKRTYNLPGSYTVSLLAIGKNGCDNVSTYSFRIADSSGITLPNVFSPNGDNINDVYRPISIGLSSLYARVFNRQGVLMHEWNRVNGSWDGRTGAGEACPPDVYFVVVEAKGFDGREYKLKQYITLVR